MLVHTPSWTGSVRASSSCVQHMSLKTAVSPPPPGVLVHSRQTPTLGFCVERHQAIVAFQPEPYWVVRPTLAKVGVGSWD